MRHDRVYGSVRVKEALMGQVVLLVGVVALVTLGLLLGAAPDLGGKP